MSIIAKNEGTNIEQLEPGVYTAISSMLIDLGIQENTMFENKQRKVIIVWNIQGETIEINGEEKPRIISKEYTLSLNEKSRLRADLQAWRGKIFTQEELEGFDLTKVLNVPCQLQLIQTEKNGKSYINIASIMALPKGVQVTPLTEVTVFDTYDNSTWSEFEKIPRWIQEKIRKCLNKSETQLDMYIKDYDNIQQEIEAKKEEDTSDDTNTKSLLF